jgi:exonuclease VII small subunit
MPKVKYEFSTEFPVAVYGNLEKYNEVLSKARVRIFYKYANRNGTYITDEFAEKLIASLPYAPVKGIYDGEDFTDHGISRSLGRIYGVVPENPNFAWEEHLDDDGVTRTYACVDVLLFTALYGEAEDIVGRPQSMEIYEKSIQGSWQMINGQRYFVFTEGCFIGLQALGEEVEPCFEGAAFFTLYSDIAEMLKKIEKYNLETQNSRQGGAEMPKFMNFKLSDSSKFDMLFELLNPNDNEAGGWSVEYAICDVFDEYAVVRNYGEGCFERVYYTKDDTNNTVTINKKEKCFIVDVTETEMAALSAIQDLNGGNYEKIDEVFNANKAAAEAADQAKTEYDTKIGELNAQITTLTTERDEANANYEKANTLVTEAQTKLEEANTALNTLKEENAALASFKETTESAERNAVIDSYAPMLSEEVLTSYREKAADYSVEDLDKELAYELKKTNPSVFTKGQAPAGRIPKDNPQGGIEAILAKYQK